MSMRTSDTENCMPFFVFKLEDIALPSGTFLIASEEEDFT
jgi:hypothetical protein